MQHKNTLRRFCVALGVGGKEKCGKTYDILRKGRSKNCIIVKIVLSSPPLLVTYSENLGYKFSFTFG